MPCTLTLPKLSPTMEEGTIAKWHKQEGDEIRVGDVLFDVATDKSTVEHAALDPGFLRKVLIPAGTVARVGQPVAIYTVTKGESIEGYTPEGVVLEEVPAAVPAPAVAVVAATAPVVAAAPLSQPAFVPEPPLEKYQFSAPLAEYVDRVVATPLARKLAKEHKIDLTTVRGSGPHGRIVQRDLSLGQPNTAVTFGRREVPQHSPGSYEEEALTPMRKVIARRLQESKSFIPHFYVTQKVSVDTLASVRAELQQAGLKLSYNDFVLRATALALREHPAVNSGFHSVNQTLIRFKTVDIAVAVSIPSGLVTPIVRHADFKQIGLLSQEVKQLATRAKEGQLTPEEYKGGSFTLSNLGMYGISAFSAIINPPQAAILAVGGIEEGAVVRGGEVCVGKQMTLTLSADHRVLDGADAARFLKTVQKYLEAPSLLLL